MTRRHLDGILSQFPSSLPPRPLFVTSSLFPHQFIHYSELHTLRIMFLFKTLISLPPCILPPSWDNGCIEFTPLSKKCSKCIHACKEILFLCSPRRRRSEATFSTQKAESVSFQISSGGSLLHYSSLFTLYCLNSTVVL